MLYLSYAQLKTHVNHHVRKPSSLPLSHSEFPRRPTDNFPPPSPGPRIQTLDEMRL